MQKSRKMFLGILFTILFLIPFLSSLSHAQWAYTYGGTEGDYAGSMRVTNDGGYIVAGITGFSGLWAETVLIKLDSNGNITWQKKYGATIEWGIASDVQQTKDGGYIIAGAIFALGSMVPDLWVLKLDSNGNITWQKKYGATGTDNALSVQQTTDDGFIVAGSTNSFGAGNSDFWLLKLDLNGNVTWEKTYGGLSFDDVSEIHQTKDGGYILTGTTLTFGAGNRDVWILKLNDDGNVTWQKTYGGTGEDYASSLQQTTDEGFIVAGSTSSFGDEGSDLWLLKLNSIGDITWEKRYGGPGWDYAEAVHQTSDSGYILVGYGDSFDVDNDDLWLLKLDAGGNVMWEKRFGGAGQDYPRSLMQTTDGGYIVAGESNSFGAGNSGLLVLKFDANGSIGSCPFENITTSTKSNTNATINITSITPAISTTTVTNTNTVVADATLSQSIVCTASLGLERIKINSTKKHKGNGNIVSFDGLISCPESCEAQYYHGFVVNLQAIPDYLSTFVGWKPASLGCVDTDAICQVTMDKKKSIKAVFQGPNKLKVGIASKKDGAGTVTSDGSEINCPVDCEELLTLNQSITLTANPTQGTFAGWTGKPCKDEPSNVCTFTMDKNYTVKAIFEGNP